MNEEDYKTEMLRHAKATSKYTRLIYRNIAFTFYSGIAAGVVALLIKYA